MDRFTRGIAMTSARHPWRTIAGWVLVMGTVFFLAASGGGTFTEQFSVPDSQSARALDLLDEGFPEAAKGKVLVVFAAEDGETLESHRADVDAVLTDVATLDHVASVSDPFAAGTVSEDGRIGYAEMTLDVPQREIGKPAFTELSNAVSGVEVPGVQVELGGDAVFLNAEDDTGHAGIGLLVALLVLVVVFGTIVAAVVPIGLSIVAVGAGIGGITLLAGTMDVSASPPSRSPAWSAWVWGSTTRCSSWSATGRTVPPASTTTWLSRTPWGRRALQWSSPAGSSSSRRPRSPSPASGSSPPSGSPPPSWCSPRSRPPSPCSRRSSACLGDRIDSGRVIRRHRTAARPEDTAWWRFGHRVSGRPWPYLLGAVVVLVALATPTLWIQTAFPAAGDAPAETTHRQAYDLLADGFGTGFNGPLLVVVDLDAPGVDAADLPGLTDDIASTPRIVSVSEPQTSADGGTAVFTAIPTTGPADLDTSIAIEQVRDADPRQRLRLRDHRGHRRRQHPAEGDPAAVHRRRHRDLVPAADDGVPLGRGAAEGRRDEPALDRCRLRRPGRGLPVGLGEQPDRARGLDADHLDHRDHVPDPVRVVHGLRGVPAVTDPGGVRPDRDNVESVARIVAERTPSSPRPR